MNAQWRSSLCVQIWQSGCMRQFKLAEHTDCVLERISPITDAFFLGVARLRIEYKCGVNEMAESARYSKFYISLIIEIHLISILFLHTVQLYQYDWIAFRTTPPQSLFLLHIVNVAQRTIWLMVMYDCQQMITFSCGSPIAGGYYITIWQNNCRCTAMMLFIQTNTKKSHRIHHKYKKYTKITVYIHVAFIQPSETPLHFN